MQQPDLPKVLLHPEGRRGREYTVLNSGWDDGLVLGRALLKVVNMPQGHYLHGYSARVHRKLCIIERTSSRCFPVAVAKRMKLGSK